MREFGRVHLIANPAAQIGRGAQAAETATRLFRAALGDDAVTCTFTAGPGHAAELAKASAAQGFGCVVALGGDGIANETARGLMCVPRASRPAFGIVPVGSGNDYARTLGLRFPKGVEATVDQLLRATPRPLDVGSVNGRCFLETLSIGLDAAIALDTVERRRRTGRTGTMLYLESGLDQLAHHLHAFSALVFSDGESAQGRSLFLMAVQIGPTYGGGFRICPHAKADDGLFDVCTVDAAIGKPKGIVAFLLARAGLHGRFPHVRFSRTRRLHVGLDAPVAIQVDGEPLSSRILDIECVPGALDVLVPEK